MSKITIVPHTSGALGYTMQMPEEEKYLSTMEELRTELRTLLGGRAAEQVVFGVKTTGASNDIQRATALARNMVAVYGMSDELGLMAPASVNQQYLDSQAYLDCSQETSAKVDQAVQRLLEQSHADAIRCLEENRSLLDEISEYLLAYLDCSQETSAKVDQAVQRLLEQSHADAIRCLEENRSLLDEISEYLLAKETITGDELMAFINGEGKPGKIEESTEPAQAPQQTAAPEQAQEPVESAEPQTPSQES